MYSQFIEQAGNYEAPPTVVYDHHPSSSYTQQREIPAYQHQRQTGSSMQQVQVSDATLWPRQPGNTQQFKIPGHPSQSQVSGYLPHQHQIPIYPEMKQTYGHMVQPQGPRQYQPQHQASGYMQHPTPSYTHAVPGFNRQSNPATFGQPLDTCFQTQTLTGVHGTAPGVSGKSK